MAQTELDKTRSTTLPQTEPPLSVECVDARLFRDDIIRLFESCGNTEFAAQFDWYYRDNGQEAPTTWLLRNRNREISGVSSVTIRTLQFGEKVLRAGVAGNLVMRRNSGLYHGALALVRAMKSMVTSRQVDILLGIPNDASRWIFERLGFHNIGQWITRAWIARSAALLRSRSGWPVILAAPAVDGYAAIRRLVRAGRLLPKEGIVSEISGHNLGSLASTEWLQDERFTVCPTSDFLNARFLQHPNKRFRIYALSNTSDGAHAYLAVRASQGREWILDCRADARFMSVHEAILTFCRLQSRDAGSVWLTHLVADPLCGPLGRSGFITIPPSLGGYPAYPLVGFWLAEHGLAHAFSQAESWHLFPGFNDV